MIPLDSDKRALQEIANLISERMGGGNSNNETNALLRELIELTKAGHTIEVDGETFGRVSRKAINGYGRRTGTATVML